MNYYRYTKKTIITGVLLLCIALVLGACSSRTSTTSATESQQTNTESSQSATRTIDTAKGKVTIPTNPKRIVSTYYHGTLIALGLTPVGANKEWWMGSPFLKEQEQSISDIGTPTSLEKVVELNPDLIVINDFDVEKYEEYSKIAPTIYVPYSSYHNPKEEIQLFGTLLNREKEAKAWLDRYDQTAEQAREQIKHIVKPGQTAALINVRSKKIAVLGENYGRGGYAIYDALQLKPLDIVQKEVIDSDAQIKDISLEVLPEYANADYIFICFNNDAEQVDKSSILDNPLWKSLPAVKKGQVYMLPYDTYAYYDPESIIGQIGLIKDMLIDKNKSQ
ncbi:Iron(3+)-hydroxamate-binding protein FhuD [Paenibacillus nuruki]|uniref:Iron(3+)-hydroxamate-binding protein FhuD n=1 Tax=Paenibacillus nuruki TaxID=1886670 RepID=A0A1E3L1G2_9BACL|nr:ABC transporter substrate-binding protein [Paenibacillus nuruki]ODP27544.1 Iron(3+)-hydroxamate-binding protein FhuD [Paenibacillus nuruki]